MTYSFDIPDSLIDRLAERFGPSNLDQTIEWIIKGSVRDPLVDALTQAGSKSALEHDVYCAIDLAARSGENYVESFLCCDVDNFSHFVDHHGFGESDNLLVQLAAKLKALGKAVYRHAGDEFVVVGQAEILYTLNDLGANIRQCIVDVDLSIEMAWRRRAATWTMFHLHQGCVQPECEAYVACRNNKALDGLRDDCR